MFRLITFLGSSDTETHPFETESKNDAVETLVARRFNDPTNTHVLFEDGHIVPASEVVKWVERIQADAMRMVAACRKYIDNYVPGADEPMTEVEPEPAVEFIITDGNNFVVEGDSTGNVEAPLKETIMTDNDKFEARVVSNSKPCILGMGATTLIYIPLTPDQMEFLDLSPEVNPCWRIEVPTPGYNNKSRMWAMTYGAGAEVIMARIQKEREDSNRPLAEWVNGLEPDEGEQELHDAIQSAKKALEPEDEEEPTYRVCGTGGAVSKSAHRRATLDRYSTTRVRLNISGLGVMIFNRRTGLSVNGKKWQISTPDLARLNERLNSGE